MKATLLSEPLPLEQEEEVIQQLAARMGPAASR